MYLNLGEGCVHGRWLSGIVSFRATKVTHRKKLAMLGIFFTKVIYVYFWMQGPQSTVQTWDFVLKTFKIGI